MRLHGWCEKCHKVKLVRVSNAALAARMPVGICAACEQEEYDRGKYDRRKGTKK